MSKYTPDKKLSIIHGFNSDTISQKEYAKEVGVTRAQFQYWLKLYELHGEEGFCNSYTNYPASFKLDVLNYMVQSGASLMDTAALFKISSYTMVYDWQKKLEISGVEALEPRYKGRPCMKEKSNKQPKTAPVRGSVEALEARIQQLEMENEYLKKLNALVQNKEKSPNKTKRK
ncbi:Transposase [Halalkalibacter krulwichiae]|uniref:Transposase n=1 Tax=Halalkalibacter krulwichiae TaxID=199441 RepID=A0A1Y9TH99_9BACI|nr:Transposase [Halalkalibacter krulwichiae]